MGDDCLGRGWGLGVKGDSMVGGVVKNNEESGGISGGMEGRR